MVIDTSALVAILFGEPEAERFAEAIEQDAVRLMSAVLEAAIVIESELGDAGARELDLLPYRAEVAIVPFSSDHLAAARYAFRTFGKGRHAAALNCGDCFQLRSEQEHRRTAPVQRRFRRHRRRSLPTALMPFSTRL